MSGQGDPINPFQFGAPPYNFKNQPFECKTAPKQPFPFGTCTSPKIQQHAVDVLSSLEGMWKDAVACDFTIKVDQKTFLVHRALLVACSDYFKAMFSCFMKESIEGVVNMKGVEESAVASCLAFMYTGKTALTIRNVAGIMQAANMMQLKKLKNECIEFLRKNFSSKSCILTLRLAHLYGCKVLQKEAENYFKSQFEIVVKTDEFCELSKDEALMYILEFEDNDDLKWKAAENWINYIRECREEDALDFFNMLNLTEFPSYDLMKSAWKMSAVENCESIKDELFQRIFSTVLEMSENITVENCILLHKMAEVNGHTVQEVKSIIFDFMLKNFPTVTSKEEFGTLKKNVVTALLESPQALFFSSEKIKWNAVVSWMKANPNTKASTFGSLLKAIDLKQMPQEFLQCMLKKEPLIQKYPECRQAIADAGLLKPAATPDNVIAVLDSDGRMHAFDMKKKKWLTFDYVAKTKNVKMVSMNGNLCILDGKDLSIAKSNTWVKVASLPNEPPRASKVISCGDYIYVIATKFVSCYNSLSDTWKEEFIKQEVNNSLFGVDNINLHAILSDTSCGFRLGSSKVELPTSADISLKHVTSMIFVNGKMYVCGYTQRLERGICSTCLCYSLTNKEWKRVSSPNMADAKLCTVGKSLAAFCTVLENQVKMETYDENWDSWMLLPNTPQFRFPGIEKQIQAVCSFHMDS